MKKVLLNWLFQYQNDIYECLIDEHNIFATSDDSYKNEMLDEVLTRLSALMDTQTIWKDESYYMGCIEEDHYLFQINNSMYRLSLGWVD